MVSEKDIHQSLYEIQMRTPVGIKQGTLKVEISKSQISGYLNIMQQTEPFYGYIDKKGTCLIQGIIKSLIKTYRYNAKGCIKKEEIDLVVYADSLKLYITGKEKRL